ncbi:hypothetical protein [cyanobacterium endosymbiont of Rhopalodia gibberula]|nr:hypothetical protein [cyanobacterium endosymbiont of Rhopalodia gibberula]
MTNLIALNVRIAKVAQGEIKYFKQVSQKFNLKKRLRTKSIEELEVFRQ